MATEGRPEAGGTRAADHIRVGFGFDVHRLVAGRPLRLGGVEIPFDRGLAGHSDGDAALHAVADAIAGAAGLGDLGTLFPDTDPSLAGVDSRRLLAEAVSRARQAGWVPVQVDLTIVAERPRLSPYAAAMADSIRGAAGLPQLAVAVKARTAEGLGSIGAGEAIAAMACVLLRRQAS